MPSPWPDGADPGRLWICPSLGPVAGILLVTHPDTISMRETHAIAPTMRLTDVI